jgi:Uma2 family endonuclease
MASQPQSSFTPEQYLEIERKAERKSEYLNGEIFAMGGASPRHVLIVTNVVSELRSQLKERPCSVFSTDLRVRVSPDGLYTYPDVVVLCGSPQYHDSRNDTLTNPTLIVEVLSKSTKDYYRGEKFEQYRAIDSFRDYLLVAQGRPHIEHFVRQPDNTWVFSETSNLDDSILLPAIGCRLYLREVYDKVDQLELE